MSEVKAICPQCHLHFFVLLQPQLAAAEARAEQAEQQARMYEATNEASVVNYNTLEAECARLRAVVDSLRAALDEAGDELKVVADQAHGGTDRSTCTRGLCGKLSRWATIARAAAETEGA